MSTAVMTGKIAEESPRFWARIAGVLYLLAVLTAVSGESFLSGGMAIAAGLIAVACFMALTVILYNIFKPVNRNLALLAAVFSLAGLALEARRLNPQGVDVAMVFHGFYCLLFGYLVSKSTILPRTLGMLMAFAGLAWLTNLSPLLANHLSPYNVAAGFLGEIPLMLWLLVMGVNVARWQARASAAGE